jgi:hypothetical protein
LPWKISAILRCTQAATMLINLFIINQLLKDQQLKAAIIPNAPVAHKGPLPVGVDRRLAMARLFGLGRIHHKHGLFDSRHGLQSLPGLVCSLSRVEASDLYSNS